MSLKISLLPKEQLEDDVYKLYDQSSDLKRDMTLLLGELERALDASRGDKVEGHFRFIMHEDIQDVLLWQAERVLKQVQSLAAGLDDLTAEMPA